MGWMDKYQNGGILPDQEFIDSKRAEEGRQRVLDYYSSPGYLKLLKKNYDNPEEEQLQRIKNVKNAKTNLNKEYSQWNPEDNSVDLNPYYYKDVSEHEFLHAGTEGPKRISNKEKELIKLSVTDPHRDNYLAVGQDPYIEIPEEYQARLGVARMLMKENGLYDFNEEEFTQKHLDAIKKDMKEQPKRWNIKGFQDVMKSRESDDTLIEVLNTIAVNDDRGQWAHPGKITKISSNQITMQGVDYPVLGISDTGDTKMMYPNQDYNFKGKSVTEYPMAQDGRVFEKDWEEYLKDKNTKVSKGNNSLWLDNYNK